MIIPKPNKIEYLEGPSLVVLPMGNPLRYIRSYAVDSSLGEEGYILKVTSSGAQITYGATAGLERAKATLTSLVGCSAGLVRPQIIEDSPRIPMRVYMLDVGRYYSPRKKFLGK